MDLATLQATLGLDSSGFQGGLNQAQSALSTFASVASGVFAGIGASNFFSSMTSGIAGMVNFVVGTTSDMESYSSTMLGVLGGINEAGVDMGSGVAAGASKAAASALAAQDALITYNEKIAEIQQNITEVTAGQNVIDAQKKFTEQLASLQESYAAKVVSINDRISGIYDSLATKHAAAEQNAADAIADMQASHDNQMADKKEKQADTLAKTTSTVVRNALQAQFDHENKLAEDSYQRQLATKKAQLERNIKEQDTANQIAADKQVATLKEQLAKEQTLENEKETKLRAKQDEDIKRLDEQNAKKLAKYQQELADEERSYELSQAKRAASGGGGGRGGVLMNLDPIREGVDAFSAFGETAQGVQNAVRDWSVKTPFTIHDIEDADQHLIAMGVNAEKMNPVIGNLAGTMHKGFGESTQAVLAALNGRFGMLHYQLGITKQMLVEANNNMPIKSAEQLFEALQKVSTQGRFAEGLKRGLETLPGQMSNVEDRLQQLALSFMGFQPGKELADQDPNSLFMTLYNTIKGFADYLQTHNKEIKEFAHILGADLMTGIHMVVGAFKFLYDNKGIILSVLGGIAIVLSALLIPLLVSAAAAIIAFEAPFILAAVAILGPWVLLGAALGAIFYLIISNWEAVSNGIKAGVTIINNIIKTMADWVIKHFMLVIAFLGPVGLLIVALAEVYKNWDKIWKAISTVFSTVIKTISDVLGGFIKVLDSFIKGIGDWIKDQIPKWLEWGKNVGKAFLDGITHALDKAEDVLESPIKNAFKMFAGKSPPDEGPLKDIDIWGFNVGLAWVNAFQGAIGSLSMPNMNFGALGSGVAAQSFNSSTSTTTNQVNMQNTFSVPSQATANMTAEYIAFQAEHFGLL